MKRKMVNSKFTKKYRDLRREIEGRYFVLGFIIFFSFLVLTINLFAIQILNQEYYAQKLEQANIKIVYGPSAPRGKIYDRNHRIIVDNQAVKTITYKRESGIGRLEEIQMAYLISDMIDVDFNHITENQFKNFWLINHPIEGNKKITSEEWRMLEERRITLNDIEQIKLERVSDEDLMIYNEVDKKAAYIYFLMNNGYYFTEKIIKNSNVSDMEYALVSENLNILTGFKTTLDWQRIYPYGEVFRSSLGSVSTQQSGLPSELKDYYLSLGYSMDDRVGISNLEFQYENYLKGTKNKYQLIDGKLILLEAGKRGNDIVLSIDIELQKEVEEIISRELILAKEETNTEFLESSFTVIQNPNTGEIFAMAGKGVYEKDEEFFTYDYTAGITTTSVVAGSIVKGASHIVAYNNGALKIGERRDDYCVKIANTPEKCSWRYLGVLDDIRALKVSSNSYQYQSAINVGGAKYVRNKPLSVSPDAFRIYREGFAEFGLGVETGIDFPNENLGYKGSSLGSGHLLDFSIGQYDTYTPIQVSQYISTIANGGMRIKPTLLKSVYYPNSDLNNLVMNNETEILNKVNVEEKYFERVKEGFEEVMLPGGTGVSHAPREVMAAGKTGTSESFIDSDADGMVDTQTITTNFIGYAPRDNPKVSFAVLTPSSSHRNNDSRSSSGINRRISYEVIKKFFEMYE